MMTVRPANPAWSLSARLGWRLAAVMLAAILLTASGVAWRAIMTVHDLDDSALQNQARLIAAGLPAGPDAAGHVALPGDLVAQFRVSDGDNVCIVYAAGHMAATSDAAAAALLAPLLPKPLVVGFVRLPEMADHPDGMIGWVAAAGPWQVVVLQGREQTQVLLDSLIASFLGAAVWLLLPLSLVTVLVGVLTLRRGLRPVLQASAAAALVGPGQPGARLPVAELPREVMPLVHSVNDALDRLELALLTQRRFMAEAAHALRTPLAVLTARLDMLGHHPELSGPALDGPGLEGLRHDADRMGRLVGQLLRMARLEGHPLDVMQHVNLRDAAAEAITALAPLAIQHGVDLALLENAPAEPLRGNHAAIVLALTNLIENALSYAPPGSAVEVVVDTPATVTVTDRGAGVPLAYRERIFERFERGPAPREGGAGLGLAIVAGIAEAHGGTVRAEMPSGGGAAFVLVLDGTVSACPR